jgi:hypothetical protein
MDFTLPALKIYSQMPPWRNRSVSDLTKNYHPVPLIFSCFFVFYKMWYIYKFKYIRTCSKNVHKIVYKRPDSQNFTRKIWKFWSFFEKCFEKEWATKKWTWNWQKLWVFVTIVVAISATFTLLWLENQKEL